MTDTGQVPGEGLPENAGMVEQPGVPVHGSYTYLSETTAQDEDLLLLPGAQGAWGNEVAPPAPEPVIEAVHEPGPHETDGRDTGSVDLGGVRLPDPAPSAPVAPRRPLHLGPPIPDASTSPVRSLADRGPAGAPVRQPAPSVPAAPEYLDAHQSAPQGATPWGAPPQTAAQVPVAVGAVTAETVGPASGHFPVPTPAPAVEAQAQAQAQVQAQDGTYGAPAPVSAPPVVAEGGLPTGAPDAGAPDAAAPAPAPAPVMDGAVPADGGVAAEAAAAAFEGAPVAVPADPGHAPVADAAPEAGPAPETEPMPETAAAETVVQEVVAPEGGAPEVVAAEVVAPEAVTAEAGAPEAVAAEAVQAAEPVAPVAEDAPAVHPDPVQPATAVPVVDAPVAEQAIQEQAVPEQAVPEQAVQEQAIQEQVIPAQAEQMIPGAQPVVAAAVAQPAAEPLAAEPAPAVPGADPAAAALAPEAPQPPYEAPAADAVASVPPADPAASPQQPLAESVESVESVETVETVAEDAANPAGPQPAPPVGIPATPAPQPTAVAPAGPQIQSADVPADVPADPAAVPVPVAEPVVAEPGQGEAAALPSALPDQPLPDQPLGQFVPVEGSVPTAPNLAPAPPQAVALPTEEGQAAEPVAPVPAPPESGPEPVRNGEDPEARAAGQEEDGTAATPARQSTGPAAPPYDDAEREAVLKVMRERRDIRNGFRSDPIPHEVLLRVLEAAHTAPSVGHSQPWDFVVIRSSETRRSMHELAMRQREAYAKSLPKGRAKQFKELKIEAILDTPVNIVVTADPTRGGRHTLGRHTQPQMAPYSAALAVENLWLAARAEGLGVGWVSFFDEREMVRALGLPEHLEVIAYLCVGYVDEFPDEPELMQAGWSKRRPLSWVVHEETYGRRALPGEEPHDLLAETVAQIRPLDAKALGEAWERQKRMTKPAGALGMLEIISAQLSGLSRQCPPPIPEPAAVAIFAGDHGVHAQGVTPWPQEVTAQMVANFLGGGAVCNAFAGQVGAEVCIVDVGVAADLPATPGLLPRKVRAGTSDMTAGPAMTREEAKRAIEVGIETARDLVAAGNKALLTGEMGIANTTASAALISVFTGADPAEVTGRGTGINDETLARKTEVVRRALELHQPDPADPIGVLAAIGGFEHAAMVGLLLGGASLRTPVILDGVSAGAAALVARAIAPEVLAACIAGHRSAEPGHVAALNKLGLRPLVDLDLRLGEGTGALLALPLVQSTARAMHEVATFDSAGVTEK
ncbi:nicotinate-nucleotide--dimethylbenzimidazole phosphoribosyltransferase [Streptomyces sp. NPDC020490]|uniref:nicotinate-nucleotide--dimethylbenzimidazole phosphoribosyltransferase n=1 Tax=Streptomyces sp. NPDC020490 TaxID=3365078 RepID=UPI00379CDF82